ncbi:MAG TPA: hypothetical protein DCE55_24565 [Planctomycetaceae bacterium]|nr:hypothetical protein [Planctomycetaceae bacterium]
MWIPLESACPVREREPVLFLFRELVVPALRITRSAQQKQSRWCPVMPDVLDFWPFPSGARVRRQSTK